MRSNLTLIDRLTTVHIVAHRENTTQLETYLHTQGFTPQISRQTLTAAMETYSPSYRCLLNHQQIWQKIAQSDRPSLIIEADFIPVQNLSQTPIPAPIDSPTTGITWLYTCAPQLYSITDQGHAQGFSAATVAYILTPQAAQALLTFPDRYAQTPETYTTWDCELAEYLTKHGFTNYIPYRNYGEHDGKPNPEHRQNGLSAIHRADLLYDRLAFPPTYATQPHQIWLERSRARSKGLARLLTGRYLRPKIYRNSSVPLRLLRFALLRQISRQPF